MPKTKQIIERKGFQQWHTLYLMNTLIILNTPTPSKKGLFQLCTSKTFSSAHDAKEIDPGIVG